MQLVKYFKLKRGDEAAKFLCKIANDVHGEYVLYEMQRARLIEAMSNRNNALRNYLNKEFQFRVSPNQIILFDDQEREIKVFVKTDAKEEPFDLR